MSSLVSFRILTKTANTFEVEVQIVHPDEGGVHNVPNYGLQIMLELYENITNGYIYEQDNYSSYPFTAEEGLKLIADEDKPKLDHLLELIRGRDLEISKEEYDEMDINQSFEYKGLPISSRGVNNGSYHYVSLNPDYDKFCELSEKIISKVQLVQLNNYQHWQNRFASWAEYQEKWSFPNEAYEKFKTASYPSYTLKFTISPEYTYLLNHVLPACFWDSAAYNVDYEAQNYVSNYEEEQPKLLRYHSILTEKEMEVPSEAELCIWWNGLSEHWKTAFFKNLHAQKHYLPTQVIDVFSGMNLSMFDAKFPTFNAKEVSKTDLQEIVRMQAFYGSGCNLQSLAPLSMLKNLLIFEGESCSISSLDGIESLTSLTFLSVPANKFESLDPLLNLSKLCYLNIDFSNQQSLDLIAKMTQLKTLRFFAEDEILYDFATFSNLKALQKIDGYCYNIAPNSAKIFNKLHEGGTLVEIEIQETASISLK
jgi:hypothetical protein